MLYATMRIGNNCEYFLFQSVINFAFDTSTKQFIPYYYCNKTLRIESHSAYPTENGMENCAEERQADHTNFANRWLIRMNSQQPII